MIGVAVQSKDQETAKEFFELFKTPWEFCRAGRVYDVVIGTQCGWSQTTAKLSVLYSAVRTEFDTENRLAVKTRQKAARVTFGERVLPIYGPTATFPLSRLSGLTDEATREPVVFWNETQGRVAARVGYDLFQEIRLLLSEGQPQANASIATLELHIQLLRELICAAGISLVEVPPLPEGAKFIACLTHDLDHPVMRNHWCDHTMAGFLYRATVGSLVHVCRGRKPMQSLGRNWAAAGSLPLVYLGMAKDPWRRFDRYLDLEAGMGATYFVIPKKGYPGRQPGGNGPAPRASRYAVSEIKPQLERVLGAGCEVALHGLDAWLDQASGEEEREALSRTLSIATSGVRMHWLYYNDQSPQALDRAGFVYDSSFGYNQTVGYRAGTAQVFKPLGVDKLLELPLHVMDTALFYPNYLNLSEARAEEVVWRLVADVETYGGALTINWHDRSIAPERLWDGFYVRMLAELKARGAWFPTALQAISWFKQRRSVAFELVSELNGTVKFRVSADSQPGSAGLRVRIYRPRRRSLAQPLSIPSPTPYVDIGFKGRIESSVSLSA